MLFADPYRIPVTTGQSHMPLEGASTFPTDDPAGKRVPVLKAGIIFLYVFLPGTLLDQCTDSLKIFPADDRFMMVRHIKLVLFITVDMPLEAEIRIGLLEQAVSDIFLIPEHPPDRILRPGPVPLRRHLLLIKLSSDRIAGCAVKRLGKYPSYPYRFFLIDDELTVLNTVTVRSVADLECTVLKTVPDSPLIIF